MASRGRLIPDNQPHGGSPTRMSHPRPTVVRVNPGRNPHAPGALPCQQDRHDKESGRDRPTQQGVKDPVPAVTVLVRTSGFGHSRPPFVKAATVPHPACGEETPLPTMGTETMQHEPAVSVSDHPPSDQTFRVFADLLNATNVGCHAGSKMPGIDGQTAPSTSAGKCAIHVDSVDNCPHFPGMTRFWGRPSAVRRGRRGLFSPHTRPQVGDHHE